MDLFSPKNGLWILFLGIRGEEAWQPIPHAAVVSQKFIEDNHKSLDSPPPV